jgi:hypothetical protein
MLTPFDGKSMEYFQVEHDKRKPGKMRYGMNQSALPADAFHLLPERKTQVVRGFELPVLHEFMGR